MPFQGDVCIGLAIDIFVICFAKADNGVLGPDCNPLAAAGCMCRGKERKPGLGPPGVFGPEGIVRFGVPGPSFEGPGDAKRRAATTGRFSLLAAGFGGPTGGDFRMASKSWALVFEGQISERFEDAMETGATAVNVGVAVAEAMIASTMSVDIEVGVSDIREPGKVESRKASAISMEAKETKVQG